MGARSASEIGSNGACGTEHRLVKRLTTPFAHPALGAILVQLIANSGRSVAVTTKQRHIGNVDGRFELDDTSLSARTAGGPLMFLHYIDAGDNHPVLFGIPAYSAPPPIHLPTADDLVDGALCSTLLTAQDYDGITFPYLHRYLLAYSSTPIVCRACAAGFAVSAPRPEPRPEEGQKLSRAVSCPCPLKLRRLRKPLSYQGRTTTSDRVSAAGGLRAYLIKSLLQPSAIGTKALPGPRRRSS